MKTSGASPIDELEEFAMGRVHNKATRSKEAEDAKRKTQQNREDDLESFFGVNPRSNSAPKSRATTMVSTINVKCTTSLLWRTYIDIFSFLIFLAGSHV